MTEKKDVREQKPFMYIVQPKLAAPKTTVQSEIRVKKTHHDEVIEIEDLPEPKSSAERVPLIDVEEGGEEKAAAEMSHEVQELEEIPPVNEITEINVISIARENDQEEDHIQEGDEAAQGFAVVHTSGPETPEETGSRREPRRKIQKKFTDMSSDELLEYLIRIPRIVPKPLCEMSVNGRIIRGQIEKKKGDTIYIRPSYGTNLISATKEEIEYITFLTF
ncbi:CotO family spore coat protein [Peribacillus sp. SCS-37]|uniref:CotO family spore coat protein n=1 Tax=Paraperibacillus esterisolvens TaxID=3115296 RepID=UPI003906A1A4